MAIKYFPCRKSSEQIAWAVRLSVGGSRSASECRIDFYCVQQIMNFMRNTTPDFMYPFRILLNYIVLPHGRMSSMKIEQCNAISRFRLHHHQQKKPVQFYCHNTWIVRVFSKFHFHVDLYPSARTRGTVKLAPSPDIKGNTMQLTFLCFFLVIFFVRRKLFYVKNKIQRLFKSI